MARTVITVNDMVLTGLDLDALLEAADQANGMIFTNGNGGKTFLAVKNADASPHNITVVTPRTVDGLAIADVAVEVAVGKTILIGVFSQGTFNQGSTDTNKVHVDIDDDTSVTIGAFRLP